MLPRTFIADTTYSMAKSNSRVERPYPCLLPYFHRDFSIPYYQRISRNLLPPAFVANDKALAVTARISSSPYSKLRSVLTLENDDKSTISALVKFTVWCGIIPFWFDDIPFHSYMHIRLYLDKLLTWFFTHIFNGRK